MVLELEVKVAYRAPSAHLDVAFFALAQRHALVRQVGHGQQQVLQFGLEHLQALGRSVQLVLDRAHLGHDRIGLGVLALALEHANLLGQAVALALQLFGAGLQGFALAFQSAKGVHIQEELGIFTGLQTRDHGVQIFAE